MKVNTLMRYNYERVYNISAYVVCIWALLLRKWTLYNSSFSSPSLGSRTWVHATTSSFASWPHTQLLNRTYPVFTNLPTVSLGIFSFTFPQTDALLSHPYLRYCCDGTFHAPCAYPGLIASSTSSLHKLRPSLSFPTCEKKPLTASPVQNVDSR